MRFRSIVARALPALLGGAVAVASSTARAAEPFGMDSPTPSPPAPSGTDQAVVARYWELGRSRPFLAGSVEAGYPYLKPRFAAGYGRPFWSWLGVEAYPLVAFGGVGGYIGVSAGVPGFTLRSGGRYFYSFERTLLPPQPRYTRTETELAQGPAGDYVAHEAEATGTVPLFSGSLFAVLTGYRVTQVQPGYYLFEDNLRVVMEPPYVWRARLGYLLALSANGAIRVGTAGEVIGLPGRDALVVRAGLLASVSISAQLEAMISLIPVIWSPDSLGLSGGDFGQLGIRYRIATDSTPDPQRVEEATRAKRTKR
jgi:hypothetical protein